PTSANNSGDRRGFQALMLKFAFTSLLLALTPALSRAIDLPREVVQALRVVGIPQSSVSVVVADVEGGRPRLELNASEPRNPASVMKLVTTYAALELLGPAYRWKTEAYLDGTRQGETLEGNLVLRGYGDPKLTYEGFWLL